MRWNWIAALVLALACVGALGGCSSSSDDPNDQSVLAPVVRAMMPPKPGEAARWAWYSYDADNRREGITLLAGAPFGGEEVYLRLYRKRLEIDPDATVRAACTRALGLWGHVDDVPNLLRFTIHDDSSLVRWELAQALQKIHNPVAIPALINMVVTDKDADVRMAAADALGQYAQPAVFSTLVGALDDTEWGVVQSAHDALTCLTGQDLGYESRPWLAFQLENPGKLFEHQRQYVWYPFVKPRGFWDKVKVWSRPKDVPPRVPTGMQAAATQPAEAPPKS
jgi:hypothetical protein